MAASQSKNSRMAALPPVKTTIFLRVHSKTSVSSKVNTNPK